MIHHIFAANTDILIRFLLKCSEITAENNKRQLCLKRILNILCKLVEILYLVNGSANSLTTNFALYHTSNIPCMSNLSLTQAMFNMSTLSPNDQGKTF